MKLALAAVKEAVYFRAETADIKDTAEEVYLADMVDVYLFMAMEEEESIGAVQNILEWCNVMTDHSWRFIRHMTLLAINGTGSLRQK